MQLLVKRSVISSQGQFVLVFCLVGDEEDRELHKILTAFNSLSRAQLCVCLHGVSYADMNSLKLGSVVSTRPMAVFVDNEPKLRKTPFCKTNAATWLPEGWSLQTKSVSAQHLT